MIKIVFLHFFVPFEPVVLTAATIAPGKYVCLCVSHQRYMTKTLHVLSSTCMHASVSKFRLCIFTFSFSYLTHEVMRGFAVACDCVFFSVMPCKP